MVSSKLRNPSDSVVRALMSVPSLVLLAGLVGIPLLLSFYFSFTDWRGSGFDANWVGWDNYIRLFEFPGFGQAVRVTLIIAVSSTILLNAVGLGLALVLNRAGALTSVYRAIFFLPMALSPLIVGFLWRTLLDYRGIVNQFLGTMNLGPIEFLGQPTPALASIIWVIVWQSLGFNMVLYLAGLQNIPKSLVEAARVDGAGRWTTFREVTFPLLAPVMTVNVVSVFIFNMREYDRIFAVTAGGPGGMTQTLAYRVVTEAFTLGFLGRGSAYATVLMVSVAIVAGVLIYLLRRRERDVL